MTPQDFRPTIREDKINVLPLVHDAKGSPEPGWCTYAYELEEAPELEVICGGINSKTPRAAALWRQGNLLHFGFAPSPERMTEAGKAMLVNAICYISRFTEDRPIVRTPCGFVEDHWITGRARIDRWVADAKHALKELEYYLEKGTFTKLAGKSQKEISEWYRAVRDYVHADAKGRLIVDGEAQAFGVPPSSFKFFEKAIASLTEPDGDVLARKLLARYVPEGPGADAPAEKWRSWEKENRPFVFFSDVGGYRWYVDTLARRKGLPTGKLHGPARATLPVVTSQIGYPSAMLTSASHSDQKAIDKAAPERLTRDVWPGKAPGETGKIGEEKILPDQPGQRTVKRITNVTRPTLTVFRPEKEKDTGAAVLIAPGGGYSILAWDLEGEEVAAWLNSIGVTGIVLKYRVPKRPDQPRNVPPLQDAQRALSLVRSNAARWGIDAKRIGMLGFSAGGHLTAAAATNFDRRAYEPIDDVDKVSCRPDFIVMIYPGAIVNKGNKELSPEIRVSSQTPPAFFAHAGNDPVPVENTIVMYQALKNAKVPADVHIYSSGGHGFGLRKSEHPCSTWPRRCEEWMRSQELLKAVAPSH
jgi:acetyl esterase/lipase